MWLLVERSFKSKEKQLDVCRHVRVCPYSAVACGVSSTATVVLGIRATQATRVGALAEGLLGLALQSPLLLDASTDLLLKLTHLLL